MKRSRPPSAPSKVPDPPAKAQKRCRDPAATGPGRARAAGADKPRDDDGGGARAAASAASPPAPLAAAQDQEVQACCWDGAGEAGGWWGWGVEEELLLGWFPFADEHFLCSDSRGAGLFWEADHDIWQLLHIHEIPNS